MRGGAIELLLDNLGTDLDRIHRRAQLVEHLADPVGLAVAHRRVGGDAGAVGAALGQAAHPSAVTQIAPAKRIEPGRSVKPPFPRDRRSPGQDDGAALKRLVAMQGLVEPGGPRAWSPPSRSPMTIGATPGSAQAIRPSALVAKSKARTSAGT